MIKEIRVLISKKEFSFLKNSEVKSAHFYQDKESFEKWIGYHFENEIKEVIIRKINFENEDFCLENLIGKYIDNDLIIKTISFNNWVCLELQSRTELVFLEMNNPLIKNSDLVMIAIIDP